MSITSTLFAALAFPCAVGSAPASADSDLSLRSPRFADNTSVEFSFQPQADGPSAPDLASSARDLLAGDKLSTALAAMDDARPFGSEDSWRINIQAGGGADVTDTEDWLGMGGASLSYFMVKDLSIEFELNAFYFNQESDEAYGANFNLLFRWHFVSRDTWSVYADAGAGMLLTTNDVPLDGSSFNFTPQAGVGATFQVADNVRALVGLRWHHVSNASLYASNPGRDNALLYAGLSFPY